MPGYKLSSSSRGYRLQASGFRSATTKPGPESIAEAHRAEMQDASLMLDHEARSFTPEARSSASTMPNNEVIRRYTRA